MSLSECSALAPEREDGLRETRWSNGKEGPESRTTTAWSTQLIDEILSSDDRKSSWDSRVALEIIEQVPDEHLRIVRRVAWTSSASLDMSLGDDFFKNALEYAIDRDMRDVVDALRARGVYTCAQYAPGMEVRDRAARNSFYANGKVSVADEGARPRLDWEPAVAALRAAGWRDERVNAINEPCKVWNDPAPAGSAWAGQVIGYKSLSTCLLDEISGLHRPRAPAAVLLPIVTLSNDSTLRFVHAPDSVQEEVFGQLQVTHTYTKNALEYALDGIAAGEDPGLHAVAAALDARGVRTCAGYAPGMEIRDGTINVGARPRTERAVLGQ